MNPRPAQHNSDHPGRPYAHASARCFSCPGATILPGGLQEKADPSLPSYPLSLFTSPDSLLPSLPPSFYCRSYTATFAWTITTPTTHFLYYLKPDISSSPGLDFFKHSLPPPLSLKDKMGLKDFPGGTGVGNPPANAGDMGSSPGPGRSHMPQSNEARVPQLLSLRSRARKPQLLSPHA